MAVKKILRDFSGWSSAHGVVHIGHAKNHWLRIFWITVMVIFFVFFVYQMSLLIGKYHEYDINVENRLKYEEREFAAVTVCSLNPYKQDSIVRSQDIDNMVGNFTAALGGGNRVADPTNHWGFRGLNTTVSLQEQAANQLRFLALEYHVRLSDIGDLGYDVRELVWNCSFAGNPCVYDEDFTRKMDPTYGLCYTFNEAKSGPEAKYRSTRSGAAYGLSLLLSADQTQYLPFTESAGLRIAIHRQGEEVFMDSLGFNAVAGHVSAYGIVMSKKHRLPPPHGTCSTTATTVERCYRDCIHAKIVESCGCSDPLYAQPGLGKVRNCAREDVLCASPFSSAAARRRAGAEGSAMDGCVCRQPCASAVYGMTITSRTWPAAFYVPPACIDFANHWTSLQHCQQWHKENTLLVEVFDERMNYEFVSEMEDYSFVQLVSDTGGQLGLWLGVSCISLVEYMSLGLMLFLYSVAKWQKKRRAKAGGDASPRPDVDDSPFATPFNTPRAR